MINLQNVKKKIDQLSIQYRTAFNTKLAEKKNLQNAEKEQTDILKAQEILQIVSQSIQQQAHSKIAGVVSQCLSTVFPEPYKFKINFVRKRGRTEAVLSFERDGWEVDPLSASGGGVVDVAAFALRLSCLILSKPSLRRVLILDEPFKFVSAEYIDNVRELLEKLSKEFKIQFIIVTHETELRAGKIINIGKEN